MTYTLEAGRCVVKDGKPLATLHGVGQYNPTELDTLARRIVELLNYFGPVAIRSEQGERSEGNV